MFFDSSILYYDFNTFLSLWMAVSCYLCISLGAYHACMHMSFLYTLPPSLDQLGRSLLLLCIAVSCFLLLTKQLENTLSKKKTIFSIGTAGQNFSCSVLVFFRFFFFFFTELPIWPLLDVFSKIRPILPNLPLTILTRSLPFLKEVKNEYMSGCSQIPFSVSGSPKPVCLPLVQPACIFIIETCCYSKRKKLKTEPIKIKLPLCLSPGSICLSQSFFCV